MYQPNPNVAGQQIVHQAQPEEVRTLQAIRQRMHSAVPACMHRRVRVQTIDGHVHEGVIVGIDGGIIYLDVEVSAGMSRAFYPFYGPFYNPYYSVILPLALYDLLVLTLLI
ncbi:acetyl-CoA acetyltransferase [Paenibacillus thermotolerans]|uniref:acetyl-CoA acetyltransferase n=1 Tax=Paenibacillus thermotolerans TaxID=3027807 RepID=UPI002367A2DA|nr:MULTISPECIES: acetyl-CoA acetyltransferase [unclassified Paenibacillus]